MNDEIYMQHCLKLAEKGFGHVAPNPMVGAVIVAGGKIIGEGYHEAYGGAHAEVNAIHSVKDQTLLKGSTIYVNLEPCSHYGKTPPCTDLIIKKEIKKVVISTIDTNPLVGGKGIEKLRSSGIEVITGVLENEGKELNKRFFTFHEKKRPYIILKWAQTTDGFISRFPIDKKENQISCGESKKITHLWRSQEQAIMIGTNTALNDDPELTTRLVEGKNPTRIVIDKKLAIPPTANIFKDNSAVLVFTEQEKENTSTIEYIKTDFSGNRIAFILTELYKRNISSVIVEGGSILLNSFIQQGLWDEARIFIGNKIFNQGIKAPEFDLQNKAFTHVEGDKLFIVHNSDSLF